MSLNWDLRSIKDLDAIRNNPLKPDEQHPVLYWLIWAMLPIGMPGITEQNKAKVYERLCIYQLMTGPALKYTDGVAVYVTMEDVERCIGLKVNVGTETDAVFYRKVKRWANDKWYKVDVERNPDKLPAFDYVAQRFVPKSAEAVA
jgi:hypothetical protein